MGDKVGRVALFGIPLQQTWSYGNTGDFAPTYYLQTDAPLYYYSFTDAFIAMAYRSLTPAEQARFDPMITGFNPADMYAADHIRRVLHDVPRRLLRDRRVHDPQGVRLVEDRGRDGQPDRTRRSTASSTSRARSGSSCSCTTTSTCRSRSRGRSPYQVVQLARPASSATRRRRSSGRTAASGRDRPPGEGPARDRRARCSTNPELTPRLHRHLLGRGREVPRRDARDDRRRRPT